MMANDVVMALPSSGSILPLSHLFALKEARRERTSYQGRMVDWTGQRLGWSIANEPLYVNRFPLPFRSKDLHQDHPLAHAASALYTSRRRKKERIAKIAGEGDGGRLAHDRR